MEQEQPISFQDILDNPRFSTKKELRPPGSQPKKRPPKINKRKSNRRQIANGPPVSLLRSENETLSRLYDRSINLTYFDQCFELLEKIGEGSFGEVYKVKSKEDGRFYAVKIVKVGYPGISDGTGRVTEVRNYECVPQHENIITLINAWEQDEFAYLQMELGYTSLDQYCEDNHSITEQQMWHILLDMLLALQRLHDNNLIHLDVKLENIIVTEDGICKLSDFGLMVNIKDDRYLRDASEGDAKYLPVELMDAKFSKAADVFSLGISMLEIAADLELPANGRLWHILRSGVFPTQITKNIPKELLNVIRRMMTRDYRKRPSVRSLLKHPRLKRMLKQRKEAKAEGKSVEGRLPIVDSPVPEPPVVNGTPVTPPNNGLRLSNTNILFNATPTTGYSTPNFSLCSSVNSSLNSSDASDGRQDGNGIPNASPLHSQPKYSKNLFHTSAKKLDFLSDM